MDVSSEHSSAATTDSKLAVVDFVVILAYFAAVIGVGIWSSIKSKADSASGYFLASRSMHWIPVGASLFASNIGSGHFIGLAGSGANSGIAIAGFELNAIYVVLILGWIFVPVYMSSMVFTMPEYLKLRFGGERIRIYLAVLALLLSIFTKISADLYAGALFINQALQWNLYASVGILLLVSCSFTIGGGLTAVIWTDFAQTILMLIGASYLMILSLMKVGGYTALFEKFALIQPDSDYISLNPFTNESCSKVTPYYNKLLRPPTDPDLPWTGMVFGLTVSAVWYWCSDQVIVQRSLSAINLSHAKGGCVLAAYLKLTPFYLLVLPGMAARVLYPNQVGCSDPDMCEEICGSRTGCSNIAYPMLVLDLMPPGAMGLMLSVMMAALMSSLTSIFNSSSTIFTMDIWKRIRPDCTEVEQVIVGRLFVVALVVISIIWIPIIQAAQGSQLFHYIQSVTSYLAPPVCAVYVLAIAWERINEKGAFWGLMIGLAIGMLRFVFEFIYIAPSCSSGVHDHRPWLIAKVHYLHFGLILFLIVCAATIIISLATEPIDPIHLYRLTFWTKSSDKVRFNIDDVKKFNGHHMEGVVNREFSGLDEYNDIQFEQPGPGAHIRAPLDFVEPILMGERSPAVKLLYTMCCMGKDNDKSGDKKTSYDIRRDSIIERLSMEDEAKFASTLANQEDSSARWCNIHAVILLVVASFFWGVYA